uniref:Golgi-associated, gamma adaptin ear containing, ARF binding protein 2 n=1 Tax=Myripristis murdjan TaxID=586833 RepID=A0A667WTA7_9TELE
AFYQLVNKESDGPQVATRLLAHKIQSPQEREALQALTVLEACMNNCGQRFHSEAAKFRFLNELIKVLSPKYLGQWAPEKVKDRVTEVLYGWTLWLKEEPKIQEAYRMLKKQGVVKKDPKLPDTVLVPPPPRTTTSVFDQEDKAKLLAKLLKSNLPEDLQTANRLIKHTIKEEQEKAERLAKRSSTLEEVETSTKQLRELLDQHSLTATSEQSTENMKALYERCDRLRPSLFRLASDTMDDDSALAQILAANDELTLVVNAYKDKMGRRESNDKTSPTSPREIKSYHLIDLSALDSPQTHRRANSSPLMVPLGSSPLSSSLTFLPSSFSPPAPHLGSSLHSAVDQEFTELGWSLSQNQQLTGSGSLSKPQEQPAEVSVCPVTLENVCPERFLTNVFVPMETIKPSRLEPVTIYDQGGVHVSFHFTKDSLPGHPEIAVLVISTVNTSALPVKDFLFQAAVPKTMSVKLQPASGTSMSPYNPLLPPPAISQVLLLANPQKRKVRLRYKLTLLHGDQQLFDAGETDSFPDWDSLVGL